MRYVYLAGLIAAMAIGAQGLQFLFNITASSLSIYKKSGAGLVLLYLMALILVGLFVKLAAPVGFAHYFKLYATHKRLGLQGFLAMFGLGTVMVLGLYVLLGIVGQLSFAEDLGQHLNYGYPLKLIGGILVACLLAITEEILFRGFLFSYLRWNQSWVVTICAVVFSSLIFATAHDIRDPFAWLIPDRLPLFFGLFVLGVLLSVTYLVTGSLWCSIGLHAGLVAFGEVFLRHDIVFIDFSPWWLGGANEIRTAPLVWLSFVVTTISHLYSRKHLRARFGIEPVIGMPLSGAEKKLVPARR